MKSNRWRVVASVTGLAVFVVLALGSVDTNSVKTSSPSPPPSRSAKPESRRKPSQSPEREPVEPPKYEIAKRKDASYANVVRLTFSVKVDGQKTREELEAICRDIIKSNPRTNAIAFFFYLPGTDPTGLFTAGKAEWAPFGDWGKAGDVSTGDYSHHQLIVTVGSLLGDVPKSTIVKSIPESERRKIFWALVKAQDDGAGDREAYRVIAKRYGITVKDVEKIAGEGLTAGWPMP